MADLRSGNTRIYPDWVAVDHDESIQYEKRLQWLKHLCKEERERLRKENYLGWLGRLCKKRLEHLRKEVHERLHKETLERLGKNDRIEWLQFVHREYSRNQWVSFLDFDSRERLKQRRKECLELLRIEHAYWVAITVHALKYLRETMQSSPSLNDSKVSRLFATLKSLGIIGMSTKPRLILKHTNSRPGDNGFVQNSGAYNSGMTDAKGNHVPRNILMLSRAGNERCSSEGTGSTVTGGNHQRGTGLATNHKPIVIFDCGAEVSITGDIAMFRPVIYSSEGFDLCGLNEPIQSYMAGVVNHERFQMNHVYFSSDVGARTIISGAELDLLGYGYKVVRRELKIWDLGTNEVVGKGRLIEEKRYLLEYLKIPLDRVPVPMPEGPVPVGPQPEGPALVTSVWKVVCTVLRRFGAFLPNRASAEAPRRPPV